MYIFWLEPDFAMRDYEAAQILFNFVDIEDVSPIFAYQTTLHDIRQRQSFEDVVDDHSCKTAINGHHAYGRTPMRNLWLFWVIRSASLSTFPALWAHFASIFPALWTDLLSIFAVTEDFGSVHQPKRRYPSLLCANPTAPNF